MDSLSTGNRDIASSSSNANVRQYWPSAVAIFICTFIAYFLTAYRTITWWDNAETILAAATLGVAHPPGALLPTILGWLVTRIPLGLGDAFMLNLFAGIVSALGAVLLFYVALKILNLSNISFSDPKAAWPVIFGVAIGIFTLAFSETIWQYSTRLTPYIFTAVMTVAILWAFLGWWRNAENDKSDRWLFIITLLLGLDFSIHRTNVLLWPAILLCILLRNKKTFIKPKSWLAGISGLILGLAFHLLIIPMAAAKPFLNASDPSNLSRFWDYISLKQYGGGWLINLFPRKAGFWHIQLMDYSRVFASNFFSTGGFLGILGVLPAIAGLIGITILWRKNWKLALGLVILFVFASLGAIIYFNLPPNYFRSIDRHYMPSFVIFGLWITIGLAFLFDAAKSLFKNPVLSGIIALLVIIILPGYQIMKNYHTSDGSRSYFALDFGRNIMNTLPNKSIVFTNGDNDTYPLWYLQAVEKFRPDVTVINISLLNTPWFVSLLVNRDPDIPLTLTSSEIENLSYKVWSDTTITISAHCDPTDFKIAQSNIADSISLHIPPTIAGKYILSQDWLMLHMIINNAWRRPIYFAITVAPDNESWLTDYLRFEGLAKRLVPQKSPQLNATILQTNLFDKYAYRGYADNNVIVDDFSRMLATNYLYGAMQLAYSENVGGNSENCKKIMANLLTKLPLNRLGPLPPDLKQGLDNICASDSAM